MGKFSKKLCGSAVCSMGIFICSAFPAFAQMDKNSTGEGCVHTEINEQDFEKKYDFRMQAMSSRLSLIEEQENQLSLFLNAKHALHKERRIFMQSINKLIEDKTLDTDALSSEVSKGSLALSSLEVDFAIQKNNFYQSLTTEQQVKFKQINMRMAHKRGDKISRHHKVRSF